MDELDTYARAAARLGDLEVEAAWWPGVVRHLAVLLDRAALVDAFDLAPPTPDPTPSPGPASAGEP
ncbi:MAG TPA: AtzG-like protein [Solirubrobacteraceae bacterium]|nr:AtzG-like protein [Solirubrobacteraceae bacterium]